MVVKIIFPLLTEIKMSWMRARVFFALISPVFSNVRSVLSQCNTRVRLLHLVHDLEIMWRKTIKHAFSTCFFANQGVRRVLSMIINKNKVNIIMLRYPKF